MRRSTLFAVCFALVLCGPSWAQRPAGMALYLKSGGEVYLLLADHEAGSRGWGAYGGDDYLERETYAWIPYSAIEGYLTEEIDPQRKYTIDPRYLPAGSRTHWLWPVWLGNMRRAVESDAIPWD